MNPKQKLALFIFLAIDLVFLVWIVSLLGGVHPYITLFNPQGIIALKERDLLVTATLIMSIGVIPVFVLLFFFAWKYRVGNKSAEYSPNSDSKAVSVLVWLVPTSIIFVIGILNWQSTHALDPTKQIISDKTPITIQVVALPWKWLFIYPEQNIASVNFIEFPVGTPINFELTADAPMSSFWIPQLGSQIYAMAGMDTQLHLMANTNGDFKGSNTEINGKGFSGMKFIARSGSQGEFDQWVRSIQQGANILDSGNELTIAEYNRLSAPSENNPPAYYASVEKGLYNTIMIKFMAPASGSSSPRMIMPEMGQPANQ